MKHRYPGSQGFALLFTDMVALNTIMLLLLNVSTPFYTQFIVLNNLAWLLSYHICERYSRNKKNWVKRIVKTTASGYSLLLLFNWVLYSTAYPYQAGHFNYLIYFGVFLLLSRIAVISIRRTVEKSDHFCRKVAIIGANETTDHLLQQFECKGYPHTILGIFDDKKSGQKIKGSVEDCINFAIENHVREIYTTISPENDKRLYQIAEIAESHFIQFKLVPDISYYLCRKPSPEDQIELPILSFTPEPDADVEGQIQKRIFDVVFSSFIVIFVLSWLAPILALLIKLESAGPVFFRQMRTGKNGNPFLCFKFRSLKMNNEADSRQVTANDDRFTRIGKFMRKTNLDELPQFFNVLLGDMSVVGSRPHMLKHTEDYSRMHRRYMARHYIKPGLTGWAQVNGYRGEIKVEEQLIKRVDHDIWYMENWDFWLDMRIVLQTLSSTFKGDKNAY
jgi:putative colanic acid biosysnthesis UDP-glucose lipid carrier transferase